MVGKPFKKGQSGNPGGRPSVIAEVRDLARQHTPQAIDALASICKRGKSESARVSAAVALLDRGYGKPDQSMNVTHRTPSPHDLSDDDLRDIATGGGNRAADTAGGTGKLPQVH